MLYFQLLLLACALEWKVCTSSFQPEIRLEQTDSCRSKAKFEWLIFEDEKGLANCTILYNTTENLTESSAESPESFPMLERSGTSTIGGLVLGQTYFIQIVCKKARSNTVQFSIQDKDCSLLEKPVTTTDSSVVEFKEQTSFLGKPDSVLGIVFALFGLLIIMVTTFYIVRKVRRRQRLERIRRYLGSSLIDPFENMQDRDQENGRERLIESTES